MKSTIIIVSSIKSNENNKTIHRTRKWNQKLNIRKYTETWKFWSKCTYTWITSSYRLSPTRSPKFAKQTRIYFYLFYSLWTTFLLFFIANIFHLLLTGFGACCYLPILLSFFLSFFLHSKCTFSLFKHVLVFGIRFMPVNVYVSWNVFIFSHTHFVVLHAPSCKWWRRRCTYFSSFVFFYVLVLKLERSKTVGKRVNSFVIYVCIYEFMFVGWIHRLDLFLHFMEHEKNRIFSHCLHG